eukprot:8407308-Karenia_brevis.AAC.1
MYQDGYEATLGDHHWALLKVKQNSKLRDIVRTSVSQGMIEDSKEPPNIETFCSDDMCDPDYLHEEDGSDRSTSCPPL